MGQYLAGDSWLHRLDARTKLCGTMLFAILVLLTHGWAGVAVAAAFTLTCVAAARLGPATLWRTNRGLLQLVVLMLALNILFTPGTPVVRLGPLVLTHQGLTIGVRGGLRLGLLVVQSAILTATTAPLALTAAAERLLAPFARWGLPAHELALMATIALRFLPTLSEEAQRIRQAQASRGANLGARGRAGMRAIVATMVPLLLSVLRRADELALAMEARAYQGEEGRSRWRQTRFRGADALATAALGVLVVGVLWTRA